MKCLHSDCFSDPLRLFVDNQLDETDSGDILTQKSKKPGRKTGMRSRSNVRVWVSPGAYGAPVAKSNHPLGGGGGAAWKYGHEKKIRKQEWVKNARVVFLTGKKYRWTG